MKEKENTLPLVSFIMPVYNAEKYLVEAVVSVINQTYTNIELVAVNDGSTDDSLKILETFASKDHRVRIVNQKNMGIVGALNNGIRHARGDYLARIDGDDACFLSRIEKQMPVMLSNPDVVLVTSSFEVMDEDSEFMYREIALARDKDIKRAMFFRNPIAHGSVLMRKSAVLSVEGYSSDCGPTEDYDLWSRLAQTGKFSAVEDVLYRWRQNRRGITLTNAKRMAEYMKVNLHKYWEDNHMDFPRLSRQEVIYIGKYYLGSYKKYGVDAKHSSYQDIGRLAIHMIKHGRLRDGILQLLALASTGRTGLRYAYKRVVIIFETQLGNILRRLSIKK